MKDEFTIRAVCFIFVCFLIAVWELLAPRRALTTSKTTRWVSNLGITFLNPLVLYCLFPVLAAGMALKAYESGWGAIENIRPALLARN